jgi:acyl-CoA thioesterase FadM
MYPLFRLFTTIIKSKRQASLDIDQHSETHFYCRPWDLDIFMEMNNGRILTLFDLGRFDLSIRAGLGKVLREQKWGLVVAGSSVRYRRRVRMFDKVIIRTQVAGIDEKWIYIYQSMWVGEQATSSVLLRTGITEQGKVIPTQRVFDALDKPDWKPAMPNWIHEWINSDSHRPWPPSHEK